MNLVQNRFLMFAVGFLTLLFGLFNTKFFAIPMLGGILLIIFFGCAGSLYSRNFARRSLAWGSAIIISMMAIAGSTLYYISNVTTYGLFLILTLILIGSVLIPDKDQKEGDEKPWRRQQWFSAAALIVIALVSWWLAVANIQIVKAVRGLWDVLDPRALLAVIPVALILILAGDKLPRRSFLYLFFALLFSGVSLAALVYPLGYGFDPFIHRATVEYIAQFGTISPKPFYYIGAYSLELFAHLVFGISVGFIDTWLVPVLSGFLLTFCGYEMIKALDLPTRAGMFALFLLPLSLFISTTPQSLAYILTLCTLFALVSAIVRDSKLHMMTSLLLALATFSIHPLAGIPLLLFIFIVFFATRKNHFFISRALVVLISIIFAVSIPIVFLLNAARSHLPVSLSFTNIDWATLALNGFFDNRFSSVYDGAYLVIANGPWILLALAVIGIIAIRTSGLPHALNLFLLGSTLSLINYLILALTLSFDFLIEYERTAYADRLLTISILFLLPHAIIGLGSLFLKFSTPPLRLALATVLALSVTAQIYGAYPRHDNYARSAGFNVSEDDISAVQAIHKQGGDADYIVLANQAVSSAALSIYGFKTYYHDDLFYYPIPTGGTLYNYYLEMTNEEPARQTILEAMDVAGVDLGFFVINDYWWQSEMIIEYAKNQADDWFSIGDGSVYVFKFIR